MKKHTIQTVLSMTVVTALITLAFVPARAGGGVSRFKNSIGMEFVIIKAGSFMMGSTGGDKIEKPVHRVRISKAFYMGKYEVTQGQWKRVMGEPWQGKEYVREGDDYPAVYVSWDDVQVFIRRLNAREKGKRYRLPTEAEWEYACRAGTQSKYSFGNDSGDLGAYAWYMMNAVLKMQKYAHRVGRKKPNPWGLYDMHGNVYEWVSDWHGDYGKSPGTDPKGPGSGPAGFEARVLRGGSFFNDARGARSADRYGYRTGFRDSYVGFRLSL